MTGTARGKEEKEGDRNCNHFVKLDPAVCVQTINDMPPSTRPARNKGNKTLVEWSRVQTERHSDGIVSRRSRPTLEGKEDAEGPQRCGWTALKD